MARRQWTDADSARVSAEQAALFGATPATDRPDDDTHNWLRDKCRDWLNRQPGVCVWNNDAAPRHGTPGTSDLLGWRQLPALLPQGPVAALAQFGGQWTEEAIIPQFVAIEIKRRRDKERVKQSGFLRELNAAGGIGLVVRDSLKDLERQWKERTT